MRIIIGNNALDRLEMYTFTLSFDKFYGKIRLKLSHIYSNGTCTPNCHQSWSLNVSLIGLYFFLISNFLISVFIYSVRWILTCNSLNKTNTTKLFLLKNVFKKLQEICPKNIYLSNLSSLYDIQLQEITVGTGWSGMGKWGL